VTSASCTLGRATRARARTAAEAAGHSEAFGEYLARLRERYRRRPSLVEILDKANLR
jgi:hypothetical protein